MTIQKQSWNSVANGTPIAGTTEVGRVPAHSVEASYVCFTNPTRQRGIPGSPSLTRRVSDGWNLVEESMMARKHRRSSGRGRRGRKMGIVLEVLTIAVGLLAYKPELAQQILQLFKM